MSFQAIFDLLSIFKVIEYRKMVIFLKNVVFIYRKIPVISPGLIPVQRPFLCENNRENNRIM